MDRRRFLASGLALASGALAGCRSMFETRSARAPPLVEDRPDAVYYPTHVEGMQMAGMQSAGDFKIALTYSFPHRFWLVTGQRRKQVTLEGSSSLHLMTTIWDPDTGMVVPNNSVSVRITSEGEQVDERDLWPMLSQNMGVHAGDNIPLDGDGTYEVALDIGAIQARPTGDFEGQFERAETSFTLEFSQQTLEETSFTRLSDKEGKTGAVDPMDMERVPAASTPDPEALPGTLLGSPKRGDAVFATTLLESPPRGFESDGDDGSNDDEIGTTGGDGTYLAVSPRTPYNGYPLPFTGVQATVTHAGSAAFDDTLTSVFDPDLGHHYGATVGPVDSGDEIEFDVVTPPQLARHEGYETAFFDFDAMSLTV